LKPGECFGHFSRRSDSAWISDDVQEFRGNADRQCDFLTSREFAVENFDSLRVDGVFLNSLGDQNVGVDPGHLALKHFVCQFPAFKNRPASPSARQRFQM
jgi:hypothetical protein